MDTEETSCIGRNTFKEVFKFYKKKNATLDLSNVYDLHHCHKYFQVILIINAPVVVHASILDRFFGLMQERVKLNQINKNNVGIEWETYYGMSDPQEWFVFTFTSKPGLIYIKNPFNSIGEKYWIARCLKDFTRKPNHLNIDSHKIINEDDDWWEYCQRECNKNYSNSVLEKLRWATLGYHYNWDTKEYSEESKNEFPEDLKALCQDIGKVFGFQDFNAQAGIVNMYHKDSSLNGHTDHSEVNLDAPLFSFSFGQSAVFLIGGQTLAEEPLSLLLRSGDITIMSKESRLCYHGVPRIINCSKKTWNAKLDENQKALNSPILERGLLSDVLKEEFWNPFDSYVSKSRINMNVRQVL